MPDINQLPIAITMGDPCGIGPEIIVKACARLHDRLAASDLKLLIIGSRRAFDQADRQLAAGLDVAPVNAEDANWPNLSFLQADDESAAIAPGIVQLEHAFKTPTLRNVNQRAPYMHDGSLATLSAVIDHYDTGFESRPSLDTQMHRLSLTPEDKADLLAFLDTLTSVDSPAVVPQLPQ